MSTTQIPEPFVKTKLGGNTTLIYAAREDATHSAAYHRAMGYWVDMPDVWTVVLKPTKAKDRRYNAIKSLMDAWDTEAGYTAPGTPETEVHRTMRWNQAHEYLHRWREELAGRIRQLAVLGRTDRWHNAIAVWADEVENSDAPATTGWAYRQYAIYACHAAE